MIHIISYKYIDNQGIIINMKTRELSIATIRRISEQSINKNKNRQIKKIAQGYVARKKHNPSETLPMSEVVKVYSKMNTVSKILDKLAPKIYELIHGQ